MKDLRINRINKGESQETFSDKINQNFSNIEEFFGGPDGRRGPIGNHGNIGEKGPFGYKGARGKRGSLWFLNSSEPTINIQEGDHWIDLSDSNKTYLLVDGIWIYQNIKLKAEEQFRRISNSENTDKSVIIQNDTNPVVNTLVLNSVQPNINKLNPQYSRVVLETSPKSNIDFDQSQQPLIEFSKINGGSTGDADKSSIISWGDDSNTNENYNLTWDIRGGGIDFNIGKDLKLYSNSGKILIESETESIEIFPKDLNINTTGDFKMSHIPGIFEPDIQSLKLTSPNFSIGQGAGQDLANLNSPIEISSISSGDSKFSFSLKNNIEKRGDGIHIEVDYNSNDGFLWNSQLDGINTLSIDKEGEMNVLRKIGIARKKISASTETHGAYDGVTYNWHGIYPSTATEFSSYGRVNWDGEEDVIISSNNTKRGLYINAHELASYYMGKDKSISISVKNLYAGESFNVIGLGGGTGPLNHYPKKSESGYAYLPNGAFTVDLHLVNTERKVMETSYFPVIYMKDTIEYCLYYEAYGVTGGTQTGILIYNHDI